jgi:hypothetical protein
LRYREPGLSRVLLPRHRFAALRAVYLKAGNAALVGCFGPAGRADARTREPGRRPGASARSETLARRAAALTATCSFTAFSSWHGWFTSLAFFARRAIIFPQTPAIPPGTITPRQPEFGLIQATCPISLKDFLNPPGYPTDNPKAQLSGAIVQFGAQSPTNQGIHPAVAQELQAFQGCQLRQLQFLARSSLRIFREQHQLGTPVQDWRHPPAHDWYRDHVFSFQIKEIERHPLRIPYLRSTICANIITVPVRPL